MQALTETAVTKCTLSASKHTNISFAFAMEHTSPAMWSGKLSQCDPLRPLSRPHTWRKEASCPITENIFPTLSLLASRFGPWSLVVSTRSAILRQPASSCGGHTCRFQTMAALGVDHGPRRSADTSLDDLGPGVLSSRTLRLERRATRRHFVTQPRHLSTLAEDTPVFSELP